MLSSGKESIVSSTSTGDQEDASRKVEIEVETGGAADNSSRDVQTATSPNQPQVEDNYSIAHDRPKRKIKRPACYVDNEGLITYAFTVAEEIPKGAEHLTYTEAIFGLSSPSWVLVM